MQSPNPVLFYRPESALKIKGALWILVDTDLPPLLRTCWLSRRVDLEMWLQGLADVEMRSEKEDRKVKMKGGGMLGMLSENCLGFGMRGRVEQGLMVVQCQPRDGKF